MLLIEPKVFADARGHFFESFNERAFAKATGVTTGFVEDNHSRWVRHMQRGLHYQIRQPQGKLVRAVAGEVFNVVVDIRRHSLTFGRGCGTLLTAENRNLLWIPPGFAHAWAQERKMAGQSTKSVCAVRIAAAIYGGLRHACCYCSGRAVSGHPTICRLCAGLSWRA